MKVFFRIVFIAALTGSFLSCQSEKESIPSKQVLRINIGEDPPTLDPRKERDLASIDVVHMLFEGLTRTSKEGKAEAALADKIQISEDGKTYLFHLRKSFWSNGEEVLAYDFINSWKQVLNPHFPAPLAFLFYKIKGAKSAKEGKISLDEVSISAIDAHTLSLELEQPAPCFLENLSLPIFAPIFSKLDRENSHWAEQPETYVCNGPFRLKLWVHKDHIEAEKNPYYWDQNNVSLSAISMCMVPPETELSMFSSGELDWAGSPFSSLPVDALSSLKKRKDFFAVPYCGTAFLRTNTTWMEKELGSEERAISFRKALALSIDRKGICNHILQADQKPATTFVPQEMGLHSEFAFPDNDPKQALVLLNKACGEKKPSLVITFASDKRTQLVAQAIQENWERVLGLKVRLEAIERKVGYDRLRKGEYQIALGSFIADTSDPCEFLAIFSRKDNGTNNTGWEKELFYRSLQNAAESVDLQKRREYLLQAERVLLEEMPIIPLYHLTMAYVKGDSVREVALFPSGFIDFKWSFIGCER